MKKAYLFGAAALLILLIVVAYIASNRQEEEAVCPPKVVGPTAAPLVLVNDAPQNVARQLFADGEFMTDEELNERLEKLRDPGPPIGGPQPLSPFLNQSCSKVYTPKTPYTPKPRPDFGEITPTSTDRLEKLLEAQRDRSSEWATRLRDMESECIEMIERQGSGPYESPDCTLSPIDEERLVEY